mgnify:CR=1 FL=1
MKIRRHQILQLSIVGAVLLLDRSGDDMAPATTPSTTSHQAALPGRVTTATTVAGLAPLTFTDSTLWPPLAWSIISGLLASMVLTLLVVPAMCRHLLRSDTAG